MDVKKKRFGTLSDGSRIFLYRVSNGSMSFVVTNYGCVITSVMVPSRIGVVEDVVLAPPTLDSLVSSEASFGGIVGRFANRMVEITPSGVIDRMMNFDDYLKDEQIRQIRDEMYAGTGKKIKF